MGSRFSLQNINVSAKCIENYPEKLMNDKVTADWMGRKNQARSLVKAGLMGLHKNGVIAGRLEKCTVRNNSGAGNYLPDFTGQLIGRCNGDSFAADGG